MDDQTSDVTRIRLWIHDTIDPSWLERQRDELRRQGISVSRWDADPPPSAPMSMSASADDRESSPLGLRGMSASVDQTGESSSQPFDAALLADPEFELSEEKLQLVLALLRNRSSDEIVVLSERSCSRVSNRRWRLFFLRTMSRCLLGHSLSPWHSNLIAGPKETLEELRGDGPIESARDLEWDVARSRGIEIKEIRLTTNRDHGAAAAGCEPTWRSFFQAAGNILCRWWNHVAFPTVPLGVQGESLAASATNGWNSWWASCAIVALFLIVLLTNLGFPLYEPDEARNAQLALNIMESGEWATLRIEGHDYWDKPPLQAWLTSLSYLAFGKTPWATRLPGAVMSFLTVLALMTLGPRLTDRSTANLAAAMLLGCLGFAVIARYATMDSTLCCFATWSILMILWAVRQTSEGSHPWLAWCAIGALMGLGIMAKGLAIVVIVVPPTIAYLWLSRKQLNVPDRKSLFFAAASCFAVAGPWYLSMTIIYPDFAVYFFGKHHLMRFANAFDHREPWWYYFPVALILMYPGSLLFPVIARTWWRGGIAWRSRLPRVAGGLVLYALWVLVFFSMAEAKLPTYILPMVPLVCLLSAITWRNIPWQQFAQKQGTTSEYEQQKVSRALLISIGLVHTIAILVVGLMFQRTLQGESLLWFIGNAAIVLAIVTVGLSLRSMSWQRALALSACVVFILSAVNVTVPSIATQKSTLHALANRAAAIADRPVVYFGRPPFAREMAIPQLRVFHFDDDHRESAEHFLTRHPEAVLVTGRGSVERIEEDLAHEELFTSWGAHQRIYVFHSTARHSGARGRAEPVESATRTTETGRPRDSDRNAMKR